MEELQKSWSDAIRFSPEKRKCTLSKFIDPGYAHTILDSSCACADRIGLQFTPKKAAKLGREDLERIGFCNSSSQCGLVFIPWRK